MGRGRRRELSTLDNPQGMGALREQVAPRVWTFDSRILAMAKEKSLTVSPLFRELFQLGIYKRSQGRIARQITFATLAIVLLLGAWRLSVFEINSGRWMQFFLPGMVAVVGIWLAFRLVNIPGFADFLIAVEAEMNKVSWPTRAELIRSSLVVIFCIFFLAAVLFGFDLFWRTLLSLLRVVDAG
jgi:preprotein translocase subunit SecE